MTRLQQWVNDLVTNEHPTPKVVLLVGGPGNGKTDAIETCVEFLDLALSAGGRLFEACAAKYEVEPGELPPRKVTIQLTRLGVQVPPHLQDSLTLVQDATESDPESDASAEALLLDELSERIDPERSGIYLCCVNRGILAHAAMVAQETASNQATSELLNQITSAVTSAPNSPKCWPLEGFEHIAVWPMDVESLVDAGSGQESVAHQILQAALAPDKWVPACGAGPRCPFCQNRVLLSKPENLNALVKLLRYYELGSGKRWTFRDLFSLVPYLLVGDYDELRVKNKQVEPCEWSEYQLRLAQSAQRSDPSKARAPYLLVSRLYFHRLFPRWPTLDRGDDRKAKTILGNAFDTGMERARDFFRYLATQAATRSEAASDISKKIQGTLGDLLDPALASGEAILFERDGNPVTVDTIEEQFSHSVRDGLSFVERRLETLERDLLRQLSEADEALAEENFPRPKWQSAHKLQQSLRQFCARLVKRSIGSRSMAVRDVGYFGAYERAIVTPSELLDVRRQLKKLLHDERNRFRASLATTFGQPVAQRAKDIVLLTPAVTIKEIAPRRTFERPFDPLPYLKVDSHFVPLTFELFKALREVVAGLHDGSLPAEIFALLNGIKSLVAGRIVRNREILDDECQILLGNSPQGIELADGKFHVIATESL